MSRLEGKVAVVTGGNSGIGKAIATHFIAEGARVAIMGRNSQTLATTQQELGSNLLAIEGDVQDSDALDNLFETTRKHFGQVDIIVANSGVARSSPIQEVNIDDYDYMMNINNRGLFLTVVAGLKEINDRGSILLIASVAGHVTFKHNSIYSSGKAAVIKMAQNLSFDLAERGIRVNSISPGYIETPIFNSRLAQEPEYLDKRAETVPLKRIGNVDDVANAAVFLSSDEAAYITGSDLLVDGGLSSSYWTPS